MPVYHEGNISAIVHVQSLEILATGTTVCASVAAQIVCLCFADVHHWRLLHGHLWVPRLFGSARDCSPHRALGPGKEGGAGNRSLLAYSPSPFPLARITLCCVRAPMLPPIAFAQDIVRTTERFCSKIAPGVKLQIRVGINSGPVVAAVLGSDSPVGASWMHGGRSLSEGAGQGGR